MTYCLGLLLDAGLAIVADTRTNAGVDNFSCYRKLHTLCEADDRQIYAASSGSLSITQSVVALLAEGLPPPEGGDLPRTLHDAPTMFRAAQMVGEAVQITRRAMRPALSAANINGAISLLLGGRIGHDRPHLFLIYSAGNFIECGPEQPFFQIGETKYGRPILDRGIEMRTPLGEALKLGFLSFDSAMRSNLGVARPLDVVVMPAPPGSPVVHRRIEPDDDYFDMLSGRWSELLLEATSAIPDPPWLEGL